jgi:DNA-binding NtrC family response regulator
MVDLLVGNLFSITKQTDKAIWRPVEMVVDSSGSRWHIICIAYGEHRRNAQNLTSGLKVQLNFKNRQDFKMGKPTAVVLDSDQTRRDDIRIRLSHCGVLPICFKDLWICLENIHHVKPAFAVFQPDSPDTAARFVVMAKAIQRSFPIILLSRQKGIENLVRDTWLLNLFFLRYPADDQAFQGAIALLAESKQNPDRPVLISRTPESQKRIDMLTRFGLSNEPVLIQGESGVGKRLMARAIYSCTASERPEIVFIHTADITGRWIRQMRKRIDAAWSGNGKVLFCVIENIEGLPMGLQSQLLLILEKPSARGRTNGGRPGARFITLAEGDLERLSHEGHFRIDLYHRLSVLKMTVPPLRDRQEDLSALADFFVASYSIRKNGTVYRLPDTVRTVFKAYHWPGNVSELKRTVKQLMATDATHGEGKLPTWFVNPTCEHLKTGSAVGLNDDARRFLKNNRDLPLKKAKQRFAMQVESQIMKAALSRTNGNCKKAAGLLNISYKSMLNKAKAYNLN